MTLIKKHYIGKPVFIDMQVFKCLFCLVILLVFNSAAASINQNIKNSASPYVAMHANDPVQWYEWGSEVLEKSKKENKPIYLTIGYFSCYWCHVLQRESFKNDVTAKILNENFISVVVDRELHPVLDNRLMVFAEKTIGRGGWPLNVVITPDGYPFMATIYLPEKKFQSWLNQVNGLWETDPDYIRTIAKDAANELNFDFVLPKHDLSAAQIKKIILAFNQELISVFDEMEGGFGDSAKFPLTSILQSSLDLYEKYPGEALKERLLLTLTNMYERGLYDHLAGGFFRYTTDPGWQVPHFEKMLYDNAQLASLYFRAGKVFSNPYFVNIGKQTLDFMLEHLKSADSGFFGSFSAIDDRGVEGGYYVWDKAEWQHLLTKDESNVVAIAWDWASSPIIAEGYLPVYVTQESLSDVAVQTGNSKLKVTQLIASAKNKLLIERKKRFLPRDEKIIASWNALSLIALIDGYEATGEQKYQSFALELVNYIEKIFMNGEKLQRSIHHGAIAGNADLEDYALLALALDRWVTLSNKFPAVQTNARQKLDNIQKSAQIERLLTYAWANFFSDKGWKMSDDLLIPYGATESMLADGPLPSASGVLIKLSLRSNDKRIKQKAIDALRLGHNVLTSQPFWYASHVSILVNYKN